MATHDDESHEAIEHLRTLREEVGASRLTVIEDVFGAVMAQFEGADLSEEEEAAVLDEVRRQLARARKDKGGR